MNFKVDSTFFLQKSRVLPNYRVTRWWRTIICHKSRVTSHSTLILKKKNDITLEFRIGDTKRMVYHHPTEHYDLLVINVLMFCTTVNVIRNNKKTVWFRSEGFMDSQQALELIGYVMHLGKCHYIKIMKKSYVIWIGFEPRTLCIQTQYYNCRPLCLLVINVLMFFI